MKKFWRKDFRVAAKLLLASAIIGCSGARVASLNHPEVMAWGNLNGIRLEGQLLPFKTSVRVVRADWMKFNETAKERERQRQRYRRVGAQQVCSAILDSLFLTQTFTEDRTGRTTIAVQCSARADTNLAGVFFGLELARAEYDSGKAELLEASAAHEVDFAHEPNAQREYARAHAKGVRIITPKRQVEVTCAAQTEVIIRTDSLRTNVQVYFVLLSGNVRKAQTVRNTFTLHGREAIAQTPVTLALDPSRPGNVFDGFGGNFRLQNPKADPQVIQYNLDNMRVAWGRVEMPWQHWHAEENSDPLAAARAGKLHPRVRAAMEMAQRLAQRGMPVIVSAWFPPAWAVRGDPRNARPAQPGGLWGNPLEVQKMEKIYASLASYLLFLKQQYGVEAFAFSFNESDLGIDVRQTAEEHAQLIKGLGAHLAQLGVATKLLLGDTSDAWPIAFIQPALHDLEAVKYIAAVSFHSWRGCTDEILTQWREAAQQLIVPLLVGEGSTDAAAWTYPQIFSEPSFALHEINLYTRICAISQPKSILQWQLTSDYSLLKGGGLFGNDKEPMQPTQRFWNMKQLAATPPGAFALPITSTSTTITCAAFGNIATGQYAVHIVNNGAQRTATLTGLPASLRELRMYVTDSVRGMKAGKRVVVREGSAQVILEAMSFTTLLND